MRDLESAVSHAAEIFPTPHSGTQVCPLDPEEREMVYDVGGSIHHPQEVEPRVYFSMLSAALY